MKKVSAAAAIIFLWCVFLCLASGSGPVGAQIVVPCKPGEVLTPDGRCLMPACPPGYALDAQFNCVPLGPECLPGRPCYAEPQSRKVSTATCGPGMAMSPDGICVPAPRDPEPPCIWRGNQCINPDGPPCRPGEQQLADGQCLVFSNMHNLNCKPVRLQIEPACLKSEGCVPEPGVAAALLFTMLVKCS